MQLLATAKFRVRRGSSRGLLIAKTLLISLPEFAVKGPARVSASISMSFQGYAALQGYLRVDNCQLPGSSPLV
jgi:hypothetical protein